MLSSVMDRAGNSPPAPLAPLTHNRNVNVRPLAMAVSLAVRADRPYAHDSASANLFSLRHDASAHVRDDTYGKYEFDR